MSGSDGKCYRSIEKGWSRWSCFLGGWGLGQVLGEGHDSKLGGGVGKEGILRRGDR